MFQTEIILSLQSFASDVLTSFFVFWTTIGLPSWTIVIVIVFLFGMNFRIGFQLLQAVIWCGIITMGLKELFALPRPANVDVNVQLLGKDYSNPTPFRSMGSGAFFGGLPGQVVEALRRSPIDSWGFPSGHTSLASTLWGSLFLQYKKIWLRVLAGAAIVFIPLSRVYLGRHFLADILGGYVIGMSLVFVFHRWGYENVRLKDFLAMYPRNREGNLKNILFTGILLIPPLLLLLLPFLQKDLIAYLFGANLGFLCLRCRGIPDDRGSLWQRAARIVVAVVVVFGADRFFEILAESVQVEDHEAAVFVRSAAAMFMLIFISTELSLKLSLFYGRREG